MENLPKWEKKNYFIKGIEKGTANLEYCDKWKICKCFKYQRGNRRLDRASARRGEIPQEILNDDEVVNKLTVFFRTLWGEKVLEEKLDEIIKTIKKGD